MTTFSSPTEQLLVDTQEGVAVITLNRPDARNALSPELTGALRKAIAWARDDDSVGALLLTGAGGAFCSGGDVKAMRGPAPKSGSEGAAPASAKRPTFEEQYQEMRARHHEISGALHRMRKPTVAVLPGPAAGAGMSIALACDFRFAADSAFLSTAYARIGVSGDYGIAWLLTRVVGPARARALLLTSERVTASRAYDIGLVNEVVAADKVLADALAFATTLAAGPQIAYGYIKDNLDEALTIDHATAIDREVDRFLKTRSTSDHKEAVKAFADKRPPVFTGS